MAGKIQFQPVARKPVDRVQFLRDFKTSVKFEKVVYNDEQKRELKSKGYHPVVSSWISALGSQDGDLYLRFHNGNVYKYIGEEKLLEEILNSPSKGVAVWNTLYDKGRRGVSVGSLPLVATGETEVQLDDSGFGQDVLFDLHNEPAIPIIREPVLQLPFLRLMTLQQPKLDTALLSIIQLLTL